MRGRSWYSRLRTRALLYQSKIGGWSIPRRPGVRSADALEATAFMLMGWKRRWIHLRWLCRGLGRRVQNPGTWRCQSRVGRAKILPGMRCFIGIDADLFVVLRRMVGVCVEMGRRNRKWVLWNGLRRMKGCGRCYGGVYVWCMFVTGPLRWKGSLGEERMVAMGMWEYIDPYPMGTKRITSRSPTNQQITRIYHEPLSRASKFRNPHALPSWFRPTSPTRTTYLYKPPFPLHLLPSTIQCPNTQ